VFCALGGVHAAAGVVYAVDGCAVRTFDGARVRTVFGRPASCNAVGGVGTSASLMASMLSLFFDPTLGAAGSLFMCGQAAVMRADIATSAVTNFVGAAAGFADGVGLVARFSRPYMGAGSFISGDGAGTLYIADTTNNAVRVVDVRSATMTSGWGGGAGMAADQNNGNRPYPQAGFADGAGSNAAFNNPTCVGMAPAGAALYVCDCLNKRIRAIDLASGVVSTLAGGIAGGAPVGSWDGSGASAVFARPEFGAVDVARGVLWVADTRANMVVAVNITAAGGGAVYMPLSSVRCLRHVDDLPSAAPPSSRCPRA
jgi:DNA-binding beta-propeller fold protein YncE